jgi:hypothetical protein
VTYDAWLSTEPDSTADEPCGEPLVIVVIAPATSWGPNRGFRHGVLVGDKRALCGRNVDNWQGDLEMIEGVTLAEARLGCRVCLRAYARRIACHGSGLARDAREKIDG